MPSIDDLVSQMRANPKGVRFVDAQRVCEAYFGKPRRRGGSHLVYKMPWAGDPRVNILDFQGQVKPYQVKQMLAAIERLTKENR
jgi:hypothetical protein